MSDYQIRSESVLQGIAADLGCELVVASDHQLLLDIDEQTTVDLLHLRPDFDRVFSLIDEKFCGAEVVDSWRSRRGNLHVVIEIGNSVTDQLACALQASLGSDPMREALGAWELQHEDRTVRCLFKPRQKLLNP